MSKITAAALRERLTQQAAQPDDRKVSSGPIRGKFTAMVDEILPMTYKSGSFGYVFKFRIVAGTHKGRNVWDNLVLFNKDGDEIKFAMKKLITRLKALGMDENTLATFEPPVEEGDGTNPLFDLVGNKALLKVAPEDSDDGEQTFTRVKAVYSIDA